MLSKMGDFVREVKVKKHLTDEQAGKTPKFKVIVGNDAKDPETDYVIRLTLQSETKAIFDEYPLDTVFDLHLHASAQQRIDVKPDDKKKKGSA